MCDATSKRDAVVLLSGGLDSSTTAAIAMAEGFNINAMTFRYGQRHEYEIECARKVVANMGVSKHIITDIDLRIFGSSALTSGIDVPKGRSLDEMQDCIPVTYVPARNTIFLSFALAWAEVLNCQDIFIGVNAVDYSGYPDCRPEFIQAYQSMANLATKAAVEGRQHIKIHAPLINLTKAQIVERGIKLGVDYSLTSTCYSPAENGGACGECDACILRLNGFKEAGIVDPIMYVSR